MKLHRSWAVAVAALVVAALTAPAVATAQEGDPEILALMHAMNDELAAMGLDIAVDEIHLYTTGLGRPANRIHQSGSQWVAGDPRRIAQGADITYIIDQSGGATGSGLTNAQTETALDSAMTTWNGIQCMKKLNIVKRADPGTDITFFDGFFGGTFGNPFAADIVNAGWVFPGGAFGNNVLAFSVSFIFTSGGVPTDINGDNYNDRALNEVYFNDIHNWGINAPQGSGFDVETVGLHEFGHSYGIGHFGPPPPALMNPVYAGINTVPDPIDEAGMCTLWAQWPN